VPGERLVVNVSIGDVFASEEGVEIRTVLGSCIAACLFDPEARVGGMNHFMLPHGDGGDDPGRYGEHAMDLLIGALQRLGASRQRLRAKVFGGGHVLAGPTRDDSVAARNVRFVDEFLADEGLVVVARDLGGLHPRQVRFHAATGRAQVRRLTDLAAAPAAAPAFARPRGTVDLFT
jgi:chemotaxis protein CheD